MSRIEQLAVAVLAARLQHNRLLQTSDNSRGMLSDAGVKHAKTLARAKLIELNELKAQLRAELETI